MEKEEKFDLIDRYLRHELSEDELAKFNGMIANDEAFQKELTLHQELHRIVADAPLEQFRAAVKAANDRYISDVSTQRSPGASFYLKMAAAAVLLMCIFLMGLWIGKNSKPDAIALYNAHFLPYEAPVNFRSEESTATTWNDALRYYDEGKFEQAVHLLTEEIRTHPNNKLAVLLRGVSHMAMGDVSAAQRDFKLIKSERDIMFEEQATWYLALSYLKQGNVAQAKTLLNELTNSRMHIEVKTLLDALD